MTNPRSRLAVRLLVALFTISIDPVVHAQFNSNNQTNIISAVISNWVDNGTYVVGSNTFLDTLIIQNGGVLSNGTGYIGYDTSASNNTAIIRGANSAWTNQFDLHVGFESAGNRLVISNGAQVVNSNSFVGSVNFLGNTNNSVLVTDPGSVWTNSGGMTIGMLSAGNQVVISNGAKVVDQGLDIGDHSGASTNSELVDNSALVTGTNSVWMNYGFVGLDRNSPGNVLTIANGGGFFSSTEVGIANSAASDSINVLVTDPGSTWTNAGVLQVGGFGSGQFIVSNGASAFSVNAAIGPNANVVNNSVVVTGPGSIWAVHLRITIGESGIASSLMITNGGVVTAQAENLAQFGGAGSLIIAGGTNDVFDRLNIGQSGGTATVSVLSGALFVTNASATAQVVVNTNCTLILGAGAFQADSLIVTNGGAVEYARTYQVENATVTVAGGNVQADSNFVVAASANSTGVVNVTDGQLVVTNGVIGIGNNGTITSGSGVGRLTVSNGTLLASSIVVGNNTGSQCDLVLTDGGVISDGGCPSGTNCLIVINSLGFTQTNGTVQACATPMELGVTTNSDCTVSGAGANDSFQYLYTGYSNVGTFTLAGGVVNVCAQFVVGHLGLDVGSVIATGAVWVTGGQLTMDSEDSIVGNSGVGQMSISNGVVTAADVTVGNSSNPSSFGTLTLAGGTLTMNSLVLPNPHSRFLFTGGWLNALGITNSTGQILTLGNGANPVTINLLGGISAFSAGLKISTNATLSGCGTITGTVVNFGLILSSNSNLTFTGILTNNGTMRAINGGVLESYGTLVNNGVIDIINGGGTNFHGTLINNGTVLDAHSVRLSQASKSGQDFVAQVPSVAGHTYQLQYTASLTPTNWTNTGTSQAGNGGVLTFTDPGGATNLPARFYRVDCTAP